MVPGQTLGGRYLLIRELGRGGMGTVFEAHDSVLDRDVAVKVLPDRSLGPQARARLGREARIVAKMDHPCVVPVYDLVDDDAGLFLVMPVLRGSTLRELLHGGPLTAPFAATVGMQVASALEYSHELGVIHRDIKPDNIMVLGSSQGSLAIKVMDFGVARTLEDTTEVQPGGVVGTVEYLSPEQVKGVGVDAPSDVYALGVLLYECLVGRPPFTGSMMDVMHRALNEAPRPLRELEPNIPDVLDTLVGMCLQKDAAARPSLRVVQKYLRKVPMATVAPRAPITRRSAPAIERPAAEDIGNETTAFMQPMAGREDELYVLAGCVARARRGALQMCLIAGGPGSGKSRLIFELGRIADARGLPMYWGRYRGGEDALPYHALCEIIEEFCAREPREGAGLRGLRELANGLRLRFPALAAVPGLRRSAEARAARDSVPREPPRPGESALDMPLFELLARTFMVIGQGRPMIIALDDVHRADVSIDALAYLARRLEGTPTLVVATYQPNESARVTHLLRAVASAGMGERLQHIELAPLDRKSHDELARHIIGDAPVTPSAADRLYQAAHGNPLAIRELLSGLREAGALRLDGDAWQLDSEHFLHARLPDTLAEIVRLRVSSLDPDARALLANATVLGEPFTAADVALIAPQHAVQQFLAQLVRAGFLCEASRTDKQSLAFANDLVRDVLRDSLSRREQARLHRRYAEGLLAREPEPDTRTAHALAHHFACAGMVEQALRYGLEAATDALGAGAPEQAVRTARVVLLPFDSSFDGSSKHAPAGPQGRRWPASVHDMVSRLRAVLHQAQGALAQNDARSKGEHAPADVRAGGDGVPVEERLQQAERAYQLGRYDEAVEQCVAARQTLGDDDPLLDAALLCRQALAHAAAGRFDEANHHACDAFAGLALHVDQPPAARRAVLARLFCAQGAILLGRGRPRAALTSFERGIELSEEQSRVRASALWYAGQSCIDAGRYREAAEHLDRAAAAMSALDDLAGLAHSHAARITLLLDRGEIRDARARAEDGLRLAAEVRDPRVLAWLRWGEGRVSGALAEWVRAEHQLQLGLRHASGCQARPEAARLHGSLARVHRARGQHDLAWSHAEQARELSLVSGSPIEQADAELLLGLVRMQRGDLAAAAEHLDSAAQLGDFVGNPYRQLDIGVGRAELDIARRRHRAAAARLDALYQSASELGARVHVAAIWRVRAALHEAAGASGEAAEAARRAQEAYRALSLPAERVR